MWVVDHSIWIAVEIPNTHADNLQIVHSAKLDSDGNATDPKSYYAKFVSALRRDWDVVDEGEMEDLLGMQVRANLDGSLTIQQAYRDQDDNERFYACEWGLRVAMDGASATSAEPQPSPPAALPTPPSAPHRNQTDGDATSHRQDDDESDTSSSSEIPVTIIGD